MADLKQRLAAPRADFKTVLLAAGAHDWTRELAIEHLNEEVVRQSGGGRLYRLLGDSFLSGFLGLKPFDKWSTMRAYPGGTFRVRYFYTRDTRLHNVHEMLPKAAQKVIKNVLTLAPGTSFQVSFVGNDPVLWAVPHSPNLTFEPNVLAEGAVPIYVWVGHGRRAKTVFPPAR